LADTAITVTAYRNLGITTYTNSISSK